MSAVPCSFHAFAPLPCAPRCTFIFATEHTLQHRAAVNSSLPLALGPSILAFHPTFTKSWLHLGSAGNG